MNLFHQLKKTTVKRKDYHIRYQHDLINTIADNTAFFSHNSQTHLINISLSLPFFEFQHNNCSTNDHGIFTIISRIIRMTNTHEIRS